MSFIKEYIERETINRRNFLLASAAGIGSLLAARRLRARRCAGRAGRSGHRLELPRPRQPLLELSIVSGGEAFVESIGRQKIRLVNLINEGSSEKSLADIKALLAKNNGNCAIACDANDSPNARPVVEAVAAAGGYISTIWNKTDDLHPWDFGDNYVSHMTWSDEKPAEETARILFEAMGGKGGVVHLGGIAANNPAVERLQRPEERAEGLPRHHAARRAAGRLGHPEGERDRCRSSSPATATRSRACTAPTTPSPMACSRRCAPKGSRACRSSPMTATRRRSNSSCRARSSPRSFTNPYWGGGITASLAYHAAIGTFKPSDEPHEHREFYGPTILITPKDAAELQGQVHRRHPDLRLDRLLGPVERPDRLQADRSGGARAAPEPAPGRAPESPGRPACAATDLA